MNNEMAKVVGTAVNEIQKCSVRFNAVPRPLAYGSVGGLTYFAKYGLQIIRYHSGLTKQRAYKAYITTAAARYRSQAEMASIGL